MSHLGFPSAVWGDIPSRDAALGRHPDAVSKKSSPPVTRRVTHVTIFSAGKEQHPTRNPTIAVGPAQAGVQIGSPGYQIALTNAKLIPDPIEALSLLSEDHL